MQYMLLSMEDGTLLYQCIQGGYVVGYKDVNGVDVEPRGGSVIIDTNPPTPSWHVEPPPPEPPVDTPPPVSRTITRLEYMNRFTDGELGGLWTAAKSSVQIEIWLEKFKLAEFIDLEDPRTRDGLLALEAAGLLTEGRANEILA